MENIPKPKTRIGFKWLHLIFTRMVWRNTQSKSKAGHVMSYHNSLACCATNCFGVCLSGCDWGSPKANHKQANELHFPHFRRLGVRILGRGGGAAKSNYGGRFLLSDNDAMSLDLTRTIRKWFTEGIGCHLFDVGVRTLLPH